MKREVKHEAFTLTKGDSGVTSQDGLDASTEWGKIWEYHIPVGIGLYILPGHTFSCYLHGDDNAQMPATTRVRVLLKDSAQQDVKTILGPVLYQTLKEFVDRDKIARFNVSEPIKVFEQQYIVVETSGADVATTGGVDQTGGASDSYFEMAISRVRLPL